MGASGLLLEVLLTFAPYPQPACVSPTSLPRPSSVHASSCFHRLPTKTSVLAVILGGGFKRLINPEMTRGILPSGPL